ncbi:putative coactivator CBP, KIX domain superfamily [Helianthus annuus]|nr:putative coactivator CBP, KIX domain superfamily [Helianthus annuus]
MPRPGPRPYECVRRAWHSDRHQPMRGSLIQEIFRVVNEIHSSTTRKNKEWQDKLPIVVLKAEEIMYSKANSEAEYMDLETLWDRANDAINTIIRLDESTETGVFLQPCIEAALNLGCTPVRTSRSQRNNVSTYYLNIKNPNPNVCPANTLKKTTQETPMTIAPFASHYSQMFNLSMFNPKPQIPILPNDKSLRNKFCFASPPSSTKTPSVYPLYYGNGIHVKDPKIGSAELKQNGEMGFVQKPSFCNRVRENNVTQGGLRYTREEQEHSREHECDLSLRIGPSQPSQSFDAVESDDFDVEARMRKRKAAVSNNLYDNLQFCWNPNNPTNPNVSSNGGSLTNAGL